MFGGFKIFISIIIIIKKTLEIYFLQATIKKQMKLFLNKWDLSVGMIDYIQI